MTILYHHSSSFLSSRELFSAFFWALFWAHNLKLVNSAEHLAKNQFQMHISFGLSHRCQNVENVHETFINTKISFKNRAFLDHRVQNVPQVYSGTSPRRLVQSKPSALIRPEENKVDFLETQFYSESSRLSTKRNLSILVNFLFPFVSFIAVF